MTNLVLIHAVAIIPIDASCLKLHVNQFNYNLISVSKEFYSAEKVSNEFYLSLGNQTSLKQQ
ncbi:MAG: hypothetical protein AB2693_24915, partial [Candidatus Thiodiazotropha sp.]